MPEREARGDTLGEAAEVTPYPLPDRLERLEAGGALRRVDAYALGRAMVDGDKDRDLALARDRGGQVRAPHRVHRLRDDGAVMTARASRHADPRRGEPIILAHEAQHPPLRGPDPSHAQPGPNLPVSLAMEGTGREDPPNGLQQVSIGHGPDRARPARRGGGRWPMVSIDAGAGHLPGSTDRGQAIGPAAHGRAGPAHGRDLRRAKGRPASRAAIFSARRSRSIRTSPSLAL